MLAIGQLCVPLIAKTLGVLEWCVGGMGGDRREGERGREGWRERETEIERETERRQRRTMCGL